MIQKNRFILSGILSLLLVFTLIPPGISNAQINYTMFLEVTNTEGDDITINDNNRQDNPFNSIRSKIFLNSWITDRIGVFVKLLYDDEASAAYGDKLRIEGAYFRFDVNNFLGLKVGKFPVPIGSFPERSYMEKTALIGSPLFYQYRTSLFGDAVPDIAVIKNARGKHAGMNIVYEACWDEGIEAFSEYGKIEYKLAVTRASYSNPTAKNNDGYNLSGRFGLRPVTGMRIGAGYAYAPYLSVTENSLPAGKKVTDYTSTIYSADFEYTAGYVELYAEYVRESFSITGDGYGGDDDLTVDGYYIEGKYKINPRIYIAARFGSLAFSDIGGGNNSSSWTWDYDLHRIEAGFGYKFTRKSVLKAVTQLNRYKDSVLDDIVIYAVQLKTEL